jgi:hypothetical protein
VPATLCQLIYVSRPTLAGDELDFAVSDIVQASIRNNREVAITGLLLVHGGFFMQALEGPRAAVEATYARIIADPRHEATKVLADSPIARRGFANWNMCARRISPADEAILDRLGHHQAFAPDRLGPRAALRLLKAVRAIQSETELGALS